MASPHDPQDPEPYEHSANPQRLPAPHEYQQYPPQQPAYVPMPVPVVAVVPTSGVATASMVFGILGILGGWCMFGIPCVLAVVFGHLGMAATKTGAKGGRGQAVTGLILGYLFVGPMIVISLIVVAGGISGGGSS